MFLAIYLVMEISSHMVTSVTFGGTSRLFSKVVTPFCISSNNV